MNAQTLHTDPMTQAAIQNGDVLRTILAAAEPMTTPGEVARAAGVPTKNIGRTISVLTNDGLIQLGGAGGYELTEAGARALKALDVWEGRIEPAAAPAEPANDVLLLLHHQIRRNKLNARRFDPTNNPDHRLKLDGLKAQIVAAGDVLQNLVVFPADAEGIHDLFAGERRWTAVGELIEEGLWARDRPLRAIQRDNTPGQTAFISLVENSQVPLTVMERARAYETLCADTGWSGREAALRTGWDVKSVQQYLQVLRKAAPAHIAAHEAGDPEWKWEALRDSVKERAEVEPGAGPEQLDVEGVAEAEKGDWSAPMRGALKVFKFSEISLTVDKSYAMSEIGHKQRDGYAAMGSAAAKITAFARHDNNFKSLVMHGYLCWGRDHTGQDYAKLTGHGERWLEKSQFPTGFAHGKYRTAWLNEQAEASPIIGGGATMSLPKPKAEPVQRELTPYEALVLLELAKATDVAVAAGTDLGQAWVKVGKYWLDTASSDLRGMGLIACSHEQKNGPHAGILAMGRTRLKELDYAVPYVLDVDLAMARELAGRADWEGPGYVTTWLNPEAAGQAEAPARETAPLPADDGPDEYDLAHDTLGKVAQALDNSRDFDPLDLFKVTGVAFPLRLAEGDEIVDNNGQPVLNLIGHGDLVDELLKARALLFVTALNDLVAPFATEHRFPALARKVEDGPAPPIRRSITPEDFTYLEDGARTALLARHLRQIYGLTADAYIERWGLPKDYPFVAPNVGARRAELMRSIGVRPWDFRTDEDEEGS